MKAARSYFVVCFILLFVSCTSKPENVIVGKWHEIDGTETIEFFKDGTVSVVDMGMPMGGNYKFIDDTRLRLELGGLGALVGPVVVKVSVSRNELILTMPDGKVLKYRRAK